MATFYDISKFVPRRTERKIVSVAMKGTPLLLSLAPKIKDGTEYETPYIRDHGSTDIWCSYGEGALPFRMDFDMRTTKMYGGDIKVETPVRVLRAEEASGSILGESRQALNVQGGVRNTLRKVEKQLWYGKKDGSAKGMVGFPDAAVYRVDAMKEAWNGYKDYATPGDFSAGQADQMTTVYVYKAAPSAEADGLAAAYGNNTTVFIDDPHRDEVSDPNKPGGTYSAIVRHIYVDAGLQLYSNIDVIAIDNVPLFRLNGFSMDVVLSRVWTLFPDDWKPSHTAMHTLAYQVWWESRQNDADKNSNIQAPSNDGSFGGRFPSFEPFGLPIVTSDHAPIASYAAGSADDLKTTFEKVRDEANIPQD